MSQGNGIAASELNQSEQGSKLAEDSHGEPISAVSAEDALSSSVKENPVNEMQDVPQVLNPQFALEPTAHISGLVSQQHQAGDSGNCHDGTERTSTEDILSEHVHKDGPLVPSGEVAGTCLTENPVDKHGNGVGGNAPDATIQESVKEGTKEETSSGKGKTGQALNRITADAVKENKKNEHGDTEMNASQHANDENAKVDKCKETQTAVKSEQVVHKVPFFLDIGTYTNDGPGTAEEQAIFMKELESFHKERNLEFRPPKFYGEGLNCLKLWRAVIRLGGYDRVTMCKLWRQVGESFNPPKTCTTVSWSFRSFYEKALLEYEKQKVLAGELQVPNSSIAETQDFNMPPTLGKSRKDTAIRSIKGWHTQRFQGSSDVGDQKLKERSPSSFLKHHKHHESIGGLKRKKASSVEHSIKQPRIELAKSQMDAEVADVGVPANWVKINVIRTKECFEVYALVPGLLREEVHVQSDAAGQVVISGEPEQPDNPWGVTAFKKIITLPSRIDPYQTSAVVTLHGQLVVRAPFERKSGRF